MPNIRIEMVYALPEREYLRQLMLQDESTLEQAIRASGLLALRQDIDLDVNKVRIFSQPAKLDDKLSDGDPCENLPAFSYRPQGAAPSARGPHAEITRRRCFLPAQRQAIPSAVPALRPAGLKATILPLCFRLKHTTTYWRVLGPSSVGLWSIWVRISLLLKVSVRVCCVTDLWPSS